MRPRTANAGAASVPPPRLADASPNQRRRQDQIVAAARAVLVEHGVSGCTERRVAAEAGVAKNLVHYYFTDMAVLIERAMAGHVDAFVEQLRVSLDHAPPGQALSTVTTTYLSIFAESPHAALLWFEFWIYLSRSGRLADLVAIEDRMMHLLAEALDADAAAGTAVRPGAARDVYVLLLGSIVDRSVRPAPLADTVRRVNALVRADETS